MCSCWGTELNKHYQNKECHFFFFVFLAAANKSEVEIARLEIAAKMWLKHPRPGLKGKQSQDAHTHTHTHARTGENGSNAQKQVSDFWKKWVITFLAFDADLWYFKLQSSTDSTSQLNLFCLLQHNCLFSQETPSFGRRDAIYSKVCTGEQQTLQKNVKDRLAAEGGLRQRCLLLLWSAVCLCQVEGCWRTGETDCTKAPKTQINP